ncbi:MAG: cyclic nucleotide-binding domain-containing protein [Planctomycetes bacterium]|nr:cyclic nucleotide-binding domain-containing protein [Planctomycetota bacterium]
MKIHLQPERYNLVPIFTGMRMDEIQEILAITGEANYEPGDRITEEGEDGDEFYIVLEGRVEIRKRLPSGDEETIALLEAGAVFGESCIMDHRKRISSAVAAARTVLSTIRKTDFENFLRAERISAYKVLENFLRIVSDRLRKMNDIVSRLLIDMEERQEVTKVVRADTAELRRKLLQHTHAMPGKPSPS